MGEKLIYWSDIRDDIMSVQEQVECQNWLSELGKLMEERDAGKINAEEYCRLCFELDKKYGLADEEDADIYLDKNEEVTNNVSDAGNFDNEFAFV